MGTTFRTIQPKDLVRANYLKDIFTYDENPEWSIDDDQLKAFTRMAWMYRALYPIGRFSGSFRRIVQGIVAEVDGESAGICLLRESKETKIWLASHFGVLSAYRGRGLGRAIFEKVQEYVRERDGKYIKLQVLAGNKPAIKLYESIGLEPYGRSYIFNFIKDNKSEISMPTYESIMPTKQSFGLMQERIGIPFQEKNPYTSAKDQSLFLKLIHGVSGGKFIEEGLGKNGELHACTLSDVSSKNCNVQIFGDVEDDASDVIRHFCRLGAKAENVRFGLSDWQENLFAAAQNQHKIFLEHLYMGAKV